MYVYHHFNFVNVCISSGAKQARAKDQVPHVWDLILALACLQLEQEGQDGPVSFTCVPAT